MVFKPTINLKGNRLIIDELVMSGAATLTGNQSYTGTLTQNYSSASTDGATSVEGLRFNTTLTGIGGVGGRAHFFMTTNVALGGWSNALKGEVTYGASGRTDGLGSAILAEMTLSAGTSSGTYAPIEIELNMGSGALTGTKTSLITASVNGADAATFDTNGYILDIQGVTAGAAKAFNGSGSIGNVDEITHGLKVRVGSTDYYILLATAANFAD